MVIFAYRQGLKDGKAISNNTDLKPIVEPKKRANSEDIPTPKEIQRYGAILDNINNYNGTEKGQKEVSR